MAANDPLRSLEDRYRSAAVVDLPTLIGTFVTKDADKIATGECKAEAEGFDIKHSNMLAEQVMKVQRS